MGNEKYNVPKFSFSKAGLLPQEETLEISNKHKKISIGIPCEKQDTEKRIGLTPEAVEILVNNGHDIFLETKAGEGANYTDTNYSERGALVVEKMEEVFQADIILKIAPLTKEEIALLRDNQVVISSLHLNSQTPVLIKGLIGKKITAVGFENIKDEHKCYPVLQSMSAIAGKASILVAAELLSNSHEGKGVLLGGIPGITPAEVVIIGAGTAAQSAIEAALGLGAHVKVFDNSIHELRELQKNVGSNLFTSVFHPRVLEKTLQSADVVIGAKTDMERSPRFWITEAMIKQMKKGSVIVDISIDRGGCIETSECKSHKNPTYEKYGVIHYCIPNLPSIMSRTSSIALSNVLLPMLLNLGDSNGITNLIKEDVGVRHGVYVYNGILTNQFIGNYFNLPSKDIDLLMVAF